MILAKNKPGKSKKPKKANPGRIPKDYAELIELWDHRIDVAIRKYKMPESEYEDLKQDIYLEFIARDYMRKIYDPRKGGAFATFFYSFIKTRALRRGCKITSMKQKFVSNLDVDSASGDPSNMDDSQEQGSIDSKAIEYLTPNERLFWDSELGKIMKCLSDPAKVRGFVLRKTKSKIRVVERSLFNLFKMLKDGWTKEDVAAEMLYSLTNINSMTQEMRMIPEMIRLRETCHDISVVTSKAVLPQGTLDIPS